MVCLVGLSCCRIGRLIAAVFLVQSIKDRPKLVGAIKGCRIIPRCAKPDYEPGANQRDANND